MSSDAPISGRNGVSIVLHQSRGDGTGYRTYEVYQRERVGESTEKIKPSQLNSEAYRLDPYPLVGILREHYPCYRDWLNNCYWVTQYNDVTSIFADAANFETRSRAWHLGQSSGGGWGDDWGTEVSIATAITRTFDDEVVPQAGALLDELSGQDTPDLVRHVLGPLVTRLLATSFGVPSQQHTEFADLFWRMQRGVSWDPKLQQQGLAAMSELTGMFAQLLAATDADAEGHVLAVMKSQDPNVTVRDVIATLLEQDYQTLHGGMANLWYQLLTNSDEYAKVTDQRLMKVAYLETLRHSPPVITALCFARHEVERFGRLIPTGAQIRLSAAAANRDPRIFADPDQFIVDRADLCQREPRGQYRADGLATGITFELGKPSIHPAVPEDRPRSRYALVRDVAVAASMMVQESLPNLRLADGAQPRQASLTVGEMHTCWQLPVSWD